LEAFPRIIEAELRGMTPGREPASTCGRSRFLVWTTQLCVGVVYIIQIFSPIFRHIKSFLTASATFFFLFVSLLPSFNVRKKPKRNRNMSETVRNDLMRPKIEQNIWIIYTTDPIMSPKYHFSKCSSPLQPRISLKTHSKIGTSKCSSPLQPRMSLKTRSKMSTSKCFLASFLACFLVFFLNNNAKKQCVKVSALHYEK
jgi:hypothetical protein